MMVIDVILLRISPTTLVLSRIQFEHVWKVRIPSLVFRQSGINLNEVKRLANLLDQILQLDPQHYIK